VKPAPPKQSKESGLVSPQIARINADKDMTASAPIRVIRGRFRRGEKMKTVATMHDP
jgi:hypothetical protein